MRAQRRPQHKTRLRAALLCLLVSVLTFIVIPMIHLVDHHHDHTHTPEGGLIVLVEKDHHDEDHHHANDDDHHHHDDGSSHLELAACVTLAMPVCTCNSFDVEYTLGYRGWQSQRVDTEHVENTRARGPPLQRER